MTAKIGNYFCAKMRLVVEEDKINYGGIEGISRWRFIDDSSFSFKKAEDGFKIIIIDSDVEAKNLTDIK